MFKIIKKGSNNFWHVFNNGAKNVSISDFEVVLDDVLNTFVIVLRNGANIPQIALSVLDIIVIDETGSGVEETFLTASQLRARLVVLGYTAYLGAGNADSITGLIDAGTNVTITGTGTLADPYIINSSGGSGTTPTLQEVLAQGGREIKVIPSPDPYTILESDKNKILVIENALIQINNDLDIGSTYVLVNISGSNVDFNNIGEADFIGNQIFPNETITTISKIDSLKHIFENSNGIPTTPTLQEVTNVGNEIISNDNLSKAVVTFASIEYYVRPTAGDAWVKIAEYTQSGLSFNINNEFGTDIKAEFDAFAKEHANVLRSYIDLRLAALADGHERSVIFVLDDAYAVTTHMMEVI